MFSFNRTVTHVTKHMRLSQIKNYLNELFHWMWTGCLGHAISPLMWNCKFMRIISHNLQHITHNIAILSQNIARNLDSTIHQRNMTRVRVRFLINTPVKDHFLMCNKKVLCDIFIVLHFKVLTILVEDPFTIEENQIQV